jgi:class 3 adenylate cyclase
MLDNSDEAGSRAAVDQLRQELAAARSAEQAVGEILKIIGRSPESLEDVFDTLLDNALRLCEAELGILFLYDPSEGYRAAHLRGVPEPFAEWLRRGAIKAAPGTGLGRIETDRRPLNVEDVRGEDIYRQGDPLRIATADLGGARSFAAIPMLAGDTLKGAFTIYRQQVRPFAQHHIELVDRFADQAVIALENTRLLSEIRALSRDLADLNRSLRDQVQEQVEELERLSLLRRFLPPEIAEIVVTSGDVSLLSSHRRRIAALFCDLRGFTAFSETAEPEEVMEVLETFHGATGALVGEFQGTITSRAGDGLMVVLNDPVPIEHPAPTAARLAHRMRNTVMELCAGWRRHGHDLGVGFGLSIGYATLGMIGGESRSDYTAIGTVVNVASRLCDRAAHGEVLVTQQVAAELDGQAEMTRAGDIALKGVSRPLEVYRLLSI